MRITPIMPILTAALLIAGACAEAPSGRLVGASTAPEGKPTAPGAHTAFPVAPASALVYTRTSPSTIGLQRFVFYDNGKFALEYLTNRFGFVSFPGTYQRTDANIVLEFSEPSWKATASLAGESLAVKYNEDALWSDFEDGVYVLAPGSTRSSP